jgi:chromosomal replication initiation ATPase DnaA
MEAARAAFRVPVKRLLSAEREFAPTRQAMYWVAREWTEREWTRIGRAYQKDHSTIMHAHELVTGNFEKFRPLVQKIEAVLAQRWPAAHDCIVMARSVGNG